MDKQMSTTIAQTILAQLGGNRFLAMTGAKDLVDVGSGTDSHGEYRGGLMFRIGPSAKNKAKKVCIKLAANDTYRVYFFNFNRRTLLPIDCGTFFGIYGDRLAALFTEQTGLDTHL